MLTALASAHSSKCIERQKPKAEASSFVISSNLRQALEIRSAAANIRNVSAETAAVACF